MYSSHILVPDLQERKAFYEEFPLWPLHIANEMSSNLIFVWHQKLRKNTLKHNIKCSAERPLGSHWNVKCREFQPLNPHLFQPRPLENVIPCKKCNKDGPLPDADVLQFHSVSTASGGDARSFPVDLAFEITPSEDEKPTITERRVLIEVDAEPAVSQEGTNMVAKLKLKKKGMEADSEPAVSQVSRNKYGAQTGHTGKGNCVFHST